MKAMLLLFWVLCMNPLLAQESRIEVDCEGWKLVGDLRVPIFEGRVPAVLMLNRAAGNRTAYTKLAQDLAARGIASLRLDLRGHGESINLGKFVPGEKNSRELIAGTHMDVIAAIEYLKSSAKILPDRIAVVGGSYSGEKMMEAARKTRHATAYVALSPGSLTDESIMSIDSLHIPFYYITAKNERHLKEVTKAVLELSQTTEVLIVPGSDHASGILDSRPDVAERVAIWLEFVLTQKK